MGGDLWVKSNPGNGSEFHFTCLVRKAAWEVFRHDFTPYQGHQILFVDKSRTVHRPMIKEILEELDLVPVIIDSERSPVLVSKKGSAALPYDVILVDSLDTARILRAVDDFKYLPIVLLSSTIHVNLKACLDIGITSSMTTPCNPIDIANAMVPALENRATPSLADSTKSLEVLLAEDNTVNQRLAVKILENYHHVVTVVGNGLEALEAVKSRRFDVILMDVQMPIMVGSACARSSPISNGVLQGVKLTVFV